MISDVLMLGMLKPTRAPVFARAAFVYVFFDVGLELLGAAWFIVRFFAVTLILSLGGGVTNLVKQVNIYHPHNLS